MDSLEVILDRLLNLLIQRPTANELLKNLETDLLSSFKMTNAIIFNLDSHNNATELYSNNPYPETADYADFKSVLNLLSPGSNLFTLTSSSIGKSINNDFIVIPISNGKILKGYILLKMDAMPLTPSDLHLIEIIGKVCAVYLKYVFTNTACFLLPPYAGVVGECPICPCRATNDQSFRSGD